MIQYAYAPRGTQARVALALCTRARAGRARVHTYVHAYVSPLHTDAHRQLRLLLAKLRHGLTQGAHRAIS
eukprot:COSAG02_NODE_20060_length_850_cov_1.033289_2_plen_69_part_01